MRIRWSGKKLAFSLLVLAVFGDAPLGYAQQAQPEMLPLHLEVGPMSTLRMPSWVALGEGLYKKNGLDVDQCHPPVTPEQMKVIGVTPPADMYICPPKKAAMPATGATPTASGAMPAFLNN